MSPIGLFLQRTLTDAPGLKNIFKEMCSLLSRSFSKYYGERNHAASFRKWRLLRGEAHLLVLNMFSWSPRSHPPSPRFSNKT